MQIMEVGSALMPLSMVEVMLQEQWVCNLICPLFAFWFPHCNSKLLVLFLWQAALVGMGICIAKAMGRTLQRWARRFSIMDSVVALVLSYAVSMTLNGVFLAPLLSLPLISVLLVAAVTLQIIILTSLSLSFNTLLNIALGLSPSLTAGTFKISVLVLYVLWFILKIEFRVVFNVILQGKV